ncbi:uncharacterized protein B0P05DRAFT_609187 [Gilbertella persicaria]|uniref:uncharacterized protein n=1 Tax=Gilbertella persicaria TaxID=101096 RepID=UPI00221E53B6|nr:uncharacterized protein B0P05DRAFT_609187 [Gilbertella persicaria]KAI8084216.1 hypothetical protein B0P05DRAFT_609187 [Gilbertella persicaria]
MTTITREHAICILYHEDCSKNKVNELPDLTEEINLEIFYKDDPYKPFLLYIFLI